MFMATKTLTIMEDVYDLLVENKLKGESFSDELRRIIGAKKKINLMEFFGILNDKEAKEIKDVIEESRELDRKLERER